MKKHILLLTISLWSLIINAQAWERIFGSSNRYEYPLDVTETYDDGYILLFFRNFYPETRGEIIKTDVNGNMLYQFLIGTGSGSSQGNFPSSVESTTDGGIIICGSHDMWTLNDVGVTKLDSCGNLEWCKTFRTDNNYDWSEVIHQLPDGGYIMLTKQYNGLGPDQRIHLFRLNNAGDLLWIQPYVVTANNPRLVNSKMSAMALTTNFDFLMTGSGYWCDDDSICRLKSLTIYADSARPEEWFSLYKRDSLNDYSSSYSCVQHKSGDYYVGAGDIDREYLPILIEMDSAGNFLSDTTIQFPLLEGKRANGWLSELTFTTDDRLFAYTNYTRNNLIDTIWNGFHEIDTIGTCYNTFLHPLAHEPARMTLTNDQKIVALTAIGRGYSQNILLMKFNLSLEYDSLYTVPRTYDYLCPDPIVSKTIDLSSCEVIVDVKDVPTPGEFYNSIRKIPIRPVPNPAHDQIRFMLENTEYHSDIQLICYDIFGRQMAAYQVNSGTDGKTVDISEWPKGIYTAIVYSRNMMVGSEKFIIH